MCASIVSFRLFCIRFALEFTGQKYFNQSTLRISATSFLFFGVGTRNCNKMMSTCHWRRNPQCCWAAKWNKEFFNDVILRSLFVAWLSVLLSAWHFIGYLKIRSTNAECWTAEPMKTKCKKKPIEFLTLFQSNCWQFHFNRYINNFYK